LNAVPPLPGRELMTRGAETMGRALDQVRSLAEVATRQAEAFVPRRPSTPALLPFFGRNPLALMQDAMEYAVDATQRSILFWDTMRRAGNAFVEHEKDGCPPVLVFEWEMLVDGRTLPRPCNYALVRIVPPAGYKPTDAKMRPFVIICAAVILSILSSSSRIRSPARPSSTSRPRNASSCGPCTTCTRRRRSRS